MEKIILKLKRSEKVIKRTDIYGECFSIENKHNYVIIKMIENKEKNDYYFLIPENCNIEIRRIKL